MFLMKSRADACAGDGPVGCMQSGWRVTGFWPRNSSPRRWEYLGAFLGNEFMFQEGLFRLGTVCRD